MSHSQGSFPMPGIMPARHREAMLVRRFAPSLFTVAAVAVIIAYAAIVDTRTRPPAAAPPPAAPPAAYARLIRAGGTLYWTVNRGDEHSVYAMTPPGRPRLLYREHGDVTFGALASLPRPAIVVDDVATRSSQIRLLPTWPGAPARILATTSPIGPGDLLTDGSRLLWADDRGLRTVPAAGGPVRVLVREHGVGDVALARGRLFYASGRTVRSVALTGGLPRTEVRATNTITALCVDDRIYWSELGVTVQSAGHTHWTGAGGHHTTGISCTGPRLAWSDCPPGHTPCQILVQDEAGMTGFAAGPETHDLHDNGTTTAYLDADGPHIRTVDPTWTYRPAPPSPSRPDCRQRPCFRTSWPE